MIGSFAAELIKLRRRSLLAAPAVMIAFVLLGVYFGIAQTVRQAHQNNAAAQLRLIQLHATNGLAWLLGNITPILVTIAVIAITVSIASEWSQGTLRNALVAQPNRLRFLAGKWAALVVFGWCSALLALLVGTALAFLVAHQQNLDTSLWTTTAGIHDWLALMGNVILGIVGWGALGLFFACVTRSAAAAVGVSLAYGFVAEGLVTHLLPDFGKWLPGQLFDTVILGGSDLTSYTTGLVVGGLYVVLLGACSVLMFWRLDVTA